MPLLVAFIVLYVWVVGFSLWAARDLRLFLDRYPSIDTFESLDAYRAIARRNMYAAIVQGLVLLTTLVLGLLIILRHGLVGLLVALAGNAVTIVFARHINRYEKRVKSLPTESEELAEQYRRITHCWGKRLLPNF